MAITGDEARSALARWQPVLRFADWDVDLRLVDGPWRKSGDVKVDLDDRKAVLLLRAGLPPEDLDEVVVHELVHIRLYALDQMLVQLLDATFGEDAADSRRTFAETQFMTTLEATTEDLAKAVLSAAGIERRTYRRLEPEVSEELGENATARRA